MTQRQKTVGPYVILGPVSSGKHSELFAAVPAAEGVQDGPIRLLRSLAEPNEGAKLLPALKAELLSPAAEAGGTERFHEIFLHEERICIVSDFIEGETLENFLRAEAGPLAPKMAIAIAQSIIRGMTSWQRRSGMRGVHGDLCPSNVMVTYDGRIVVREFALSMLLSGDPGASKIVGDVRYMAPERIRNPRGTERDADTYSLGLILYRLVTGQPAISGENPKQLLAAASKPRIAKPSSITKCWAALEKVILDAAAPEASKRPSGMEEVEFALSEIVSTRKLHLDADQELPKLMQRHFQHRARALGIMKKRWRAAGESVAMAPEPKSRSTSVRGPRATSTPLRSESGFELIGAPKSAGAAGPARSARSRPEPTALSATFSPNLGACDLPSSDLVSGDLPFRDLASRDLPRIDPNARDLPKVDARESSTSDVASSETGELPRPRRRQLSFGAGVLLCVSLSLALSAAALYLPPEWRKLILELTRAAGDAVSFATERIVASWGP